MNYHPDVFIYTALACEAKPLVARYHLKKESRLQPFAVYRNGNICLTVTGLGKTAMAAGVAYTQAIYAGTGQPILINLGVAGQQTQAIGKPFIVHKIIDAETGKRFYPVPAFAFPCASAAIMTASKPQLDYDHAHLCDMEASAFYETASRFTTGELIQCLKVVSDNQTVPAIGLDAKQVTDLIARNLGVLDSLVSEMNRLARQIHPGQSDDCFDRLVGLYRFTVSEQSQLKNLLLKWQALTEHRPLKFDSGDMKNGKDILRWLEQQIDDLAVVL
ncbi:MAG: hypothetical protein ACU85E_05275 [Gammaproteobacteria bacterium]